MEALSTNISRNLCDKLYEKRKQGAQELEILIKDLNRKNDKEKILQIIDYIIVNLSTSPNGNHRKGALIALASVTLALEIDANELLKEIVPPVIKSFGDHDSRVRYYACEAMYNITKVVRTNILPFFSEIFDSLFKLSSDPDAQVKKGLHLLDRLLKDVATDDELFSVDMLVLLVKDRLYIGDPNARQFLLGWIRALDSVPHINLLPYLPELLDGIFNMLTVTNTNEDINCTVENVLGEFLQEIEKSPKKVDFESLVKILIPRCAGQNDITHLIALSWLHSFVNVGGNILVPYVHSILGAILPSVSSTNQEIREKAIETNTLLTKIINETDKGVSVSLLLEQITVQLRSGKVHSRLTGLSWVNLLFSKYSEAMEDHLDKLFSIMLKMVSDSSEVASKSIDVMTHIAHNEEYFIRLMTSLVSLFSSDQTLLKQKGTSLLRQLSSSLTPEKLYGTLATLLENSEYSPDFCSLFIQILNLILLTSVEFADMRKNLKDLLNHEHKTLFILLYKSWCHNPAATFSLCLIAEAYDHAYDLVCKFAELDISVEFLIEIDKLVQLIESPIFTGLRMQLLEPRLYPSLYKCLYGILMLLPQSDAFETLKNRLNSIATLGQVYLLQKDDVTVKSIPSQSSINFSELSQHFLDVQKQHKTNKN